MTNGEISNQLESLIDKTSVSFVLRTISEICGEKAEHIRHNWQDETSAKEWVKAASLIGMQADSLSSL